MTNTTEIKLSPAMVTALKGATILTNEDGTRSVAGLPAETKTQTVKGLESRGLSEGLELTPEGVEAAFQLGNDIRPVELTDDVQLDQQADEIAVLEELLQPVGHSFDQKTGVVDSKPVDAGLSAEQAKFGEALGKLLDTPHVVPNRQDKRKARFSLKAAYSRMVERKRQRKIKKYGTTKYNGEVA